MNKLFNNHYNLFISISTVTILAIGIWYLTLFTSLKTENNKLARDLKSQKSKSTQAEKTFNDLASVKREWSDYNLDFEYFFWTDDDVLVFVKGSLLSKF